MSADINTLRNNLRKSLRRQANITKLKHEAYMAALPEGERFSDNAEWDFFALLIAEAHAAGEAKEREHGC